MDKLELQVVGPLLYVARKQANGTDTIRPLLLAKDVVRFALSRASVWLSLLALVLCLSCIGLAVFAPIFAQTNKQDVPNAEGVDDSALRAELLAAWDRLYEKRNKLGRPYESSTWVRTYRDGVLVEEYRTFTKRNRSCVLRGHEPTLAKLNPGLDRHFIVCINPVYAFHIERENPEDPWLLRKVVLASAEKAFAQFEAQRQGAISGSRQRTNFGAARLPVAVYDLVASSEFTIRRLSGGQHADYEMEVLLENRRPVQANSIVSGYRTITLLLDKRYDYWIRKFCARRQSPRYQWGWWEIHEECEAIASGENVVEIPEIQKTICRIHETQYDAQGRVTGKHATVHESVPQGSQRQREPRDEEFTLSYYGLPEPAGVTWPKPRPWWLYLSLTGLALVVMGLALGTYLRWRRTRLAQISAN